MMLSEEEIQRLQDTVTVLESENRDLRRLRDMDLRLELDRAISQLGTATERLVRTAGLLVEEKRDERARGNTKRSQEKNTAVQSNANQQVPQGRVASGPNTRPVREVPPATNL